MHKTERADGSVRLITYNIHSCVGTDGVLSPDRIVEVVAAWEPDIVALQEVDVGRARTGGDDQAATIADALGMSSRFHPIVRFRGERYGVAVMSRFPVRTVRGGILPGQPGGKRCREPRGALWVEVETGAAPLQVLNTHLGLSARERARQVDALLGDEWLGHPRFREPVVVCGDLNSLPRSRTYRRLRRELRDAQLAVRSHRPRSTFTSRYPFARIDHVFVGREVDVAAVRVARSPLERVASDHLPLIVDVGLRRGRDSA